MGKVAAAIPVINQIEVSIDVSNMNQESDFFHIWRFTDGKPGHENQSLGLVQALEKRVKCQVREWEIPSTFIERWRWRKNWNLQAQKAVNPHLVLGAGHRTHWMVLLSKKKYGGKSVVLMKPSLPLSLFDLCVIPEHDQVKLRSNVIQIQGVLNTICASNKQVPNKGLMLIGGPCRHVDWSNQEVVDQVVAIVLSSPEIHWTLTTSRRTPDSFLKLLSAKCAAGNLTVVPVSATQPGWVARKLAVSKQVWATSDSVSMLYEAITSGASTGVLDVSWNATGKLRDGLENLIRSKMVTTFADRRASECLPPPSAPLAEASRVADWILNHWYAERNSS